MPQLKLKVMKNKALLNQIENAAFVNAWARCSYTAVALHCHEAKIWPVVDEIPHGSEWAGRGWANVGKLEKQPSLTIGEVLVCFGEVFCERLVPNLILSICFQWNIFKVHSRSFKASKVPVGEHRVRLWEVFVDKADNASRAVKSQLGISTDSTVAWWIQNPGWLIRASPQ